MKSCSLFITSHWTLLQNYCWQKLERQQWSPIQPTFCRVTLSNSSEKIHKWLKFSKSTDISRQPNAYLFENQLRSPYLPSQRTNHLAELHILSTSSTSVVDRTTQI